MAKSSSSSSSSSHKADVVYENGAAVQAQRPQYQSQQPMQLAIDPERGSPPSSIPPDESHSQSHSQSRSESVEVVEVANFREKEKVKREKSIHSWSLGRSDLSSHLIKACFAEAFGCFFLILICVGSANSRILVALTTGVTHLRSLYYIGISMSFGIGCASIIHILSETSGGHINPAVSLALFLDRRISFIHCLFYVIAQFLGGFLGAGVLYGMGNHGNLTTEIYGGNSYSEDDITWLQALFFELFGTMFLVLVVFATIDVRRGHEQSYLQPFAIGLAILVLHIWLIPYTNCAINPVRGTVWDIVSGTSKNQTFIFLFAPLLGGAVAVPIYNIIFK